MQIYVNKISPLAELPTVAYNGTSAAFDITCVEDTVIPAKGSARVPNGLKLSIPQNSPYYMLVSLRSSMGFKRDLICHPGIIDAGYTGELGIKVFNLNNSDVTIKAGERYAQVIVLEKVAYSFTELDASEWETYEEQQERGANGFGSSNGNTANCTTQELHS